VQVVPQNHSQNEEKATAYQTQPFSVEKWKEDIYNTAFKKSKGANQGNESARK
jgi:hypothetical protein